MAITFKRKPRFQEATEAKTNKEVLDMVGLSRGEKKGFPDRLFKFQKGDRVRIRRKALEFIKHYEIGDTGIVLDSWPPVPEACRILGSKGYGLVKVHLDKPRWGSDTWQFFDDYTLEPEDLNEDVAEVVGS